jgi:hypothetical protein
MKYLVVLKKAAVAPIGFDTPEQAVADFLLKCSKITPDGVIAEMKKRIPSSKKRKGGLPFTSCYLCRNTGSFRFRTRRNVKIRDDCCQNNRERKENKGAFF